MYVCVCVCVYVYLWVCVLRRRSLCNGYGRNKQEKAVYISQSNNIFGKNRTPVFSLQLWINSRAD